MTPLSTFWYSFALASSAGPVKGCTVEPGYRPYAPLRVPPSVLTPRPPSSAEPSQTKRVVFPRRGTAREQAGHGDGN